MAKLPTEMRHLDVRLRSSEYLDEELAPQARAEFEGHLRSCPACRRFVEELRAVIELLAETGYRGPLGE